MNVRTVPEDTPPPDRLTSRHRVLYLVAVGFAVVALMIGGGYLVAAGMADAHRVARTMLASLFVVAAAGSVTTFVAALTAKLIGLMLRSLKCSLKRHIDRAGAESVRDQLLMLARAVAAVREQMPDLARIPADVRDQNRAYAAQLDRACERMGGKMDAIAEAVASEVGKIAERVGELEQHERQNAAWAPDGDLMLGMAAWAASLDHRLSDVQRNLTRQDAMVPAQSNGHGENCSPLELSDEALRGYFLGFYDRERDGGTAAT